MKVLGESSDSYIVEMSKDEMANLQGLYRKFSYRSDICKIPECGDTVEIEKFYDMVHNVSSVIGDINQFRKKMASMLKYLHDFEFVTRETDEEV